MTTAPEAELTWAADPVIGVTRLRLPDAVELVDDNALVISVATIAPDALDSAEDEPATAPVAGDSEPNDDEAVADNPDSPSVL